MIRIYYEKNGTPVADSKVEEVLLKAKEVDVDFHVSTENFIYGCRKLVAEGKINPDDVKFFHEDKLIGSPNRFGKLPSWPNGFCDYFDGCLTAILGYEIEEGRRRREEANKKL